MSETADLIEQHRAGRSFSEMVQGTSMRPELLAKLASGRAFAAELTDNAIAQLAAVLDIPEAVVAATMYADVYGNDPAPTQPQETP